MCIFLCSRNSIVFILMRPAEHSKQSQYISGDFKARNLKRSSRDYLLFDKKRFHYFETSFTTIFFLISGLATKIFFSYGYGLSNIITTDSFYTLLDLMKDKE